MDPVHYSTVVQESRFPLPRWCRLCEISFEGHFEGLACWIRANVSYCIQWTLNIPAVLNDWCKIFTLKVSYFNLQQIARISPLTYVHLRWNHLIWIYGSPTGVRGRGAEAILFFAAKLMLLQWQSSNIFTPKFKPKVFSHPTPAPHQIEGSPVHSCTSDNAY